MSTLQEGSSRSSSAPHSGEENELIAGSPFDIQGQTDRYVSVLDGLNMLGENPDEAIQAVRDSFQALHDMVAADPFLRRVGGTPYFAIDLPEDDPEAFTKFRAAYDEHSAAYGAPPMEVHESFVGQFSAAELSRRSFADEPAVRGGAFYMLHGGNRSNEPGLYLTDQAVPEQIEASKAMRAQYAAEHSGSELVMVSLVDYAVIDAAQLEASRLGENAPPLDGEESATLTRILQAGDPETGLKESADEEGYWTLGVLSNGRELEARRAGVDADEAIGVRFAVRPKAA